MLQMRLSRARCLLLESRRIRKVLGSSIYFATGVACSLFDHANTDYLVERTAVTEVHSVSGVRLALTFRYLIFNARAPSPDDSYSNLTITLIMH